MGDVLVDEVYFKERGSGYWVLKYHSTEPDRDTWALNEFNKVYSTSLSQYSMHVH